MLAKSLNATGDEPLTRPDGTAIQWREDLARKLIDLQQADGTWVNANNRWWEGDPNLVTAYTLLALSNLLQ